MPKAVAVALAALLATQPVGAVETVMGIDLVKIATIPRGQINFYQLPVGDMDHDGRRELVFEQSLDPFSANIWEHWGSNSYQPVKILKEGCAPAVEGDPDQDGLSDLLCQWGGRAFLLESQTPTTFPSRTVWEEPIGGFPGIRGYFEDTDRDGRQEMWIVPNDPDQIEVWENRGDDTYELVALLTEPTMLPATLAFADFDGDAKTEIVVGTSLHNLFMWETTGDDAWDLVWSYEFPFNWSTPIVTAARDLDGDGKPEFLAGTKILDTFEHAVTVFEATGDDVYAPVWQVQGEGSFSQTHVAVGDVDGDGVEEFAVATPGAIQLYEAFGDDDFGLIEEVPYAEGSLVGDTAIELADLNGNGVDELIFNGAANPNHTPIRIFLDELADLQPPVLIPAFFPTRYAVPSGQPLPVHAELFNRTDQTQTVDVWAEVYRGSGQGGPQGPLLRRQLLLSQAPLPPGRTVTHRFSLTVPCPPGPCTLQLKVGTFPTEVTDTRWFTVVVTPADS